MTAARPRRIPLVAVALLALLLVAGLMPLIGPGSTQGVPSYCPQGDDGPEPPASGTQPHRDLVVGDTSMTLVPSGGGAEVAGDERGVHTVFASGGALNVTVAVDEVGGEGGSGNTILRATLGRPDGTTLVRSATIPVPAENGNTTHTFRFDIGPGRHTIVFHVNPDQNPPESCTDGIPNSACPSGGANGCSQTYYDNNRRTVGILAGRLPDLRVAAVAQNGPTRATAEPHDDSEASFRITVANDGQGSAFNLSAINPGARPMTLRVAVSDCDCAPQMVEVGQIAVGATKSVTTAPFALHGLTDDIRLNITLDPDDWVAEADEANNLDQRTLPLATPDLVASANAELPLEGNAYVTPLGRDLTFSVAVTNTGLGHAAKQDGGTFRITVHQDDAAEPILERNVTLEGLASASYTVTVPADNVTGSHTFTVSADPDDVVFESDDGNNDAELRLVVAVYEAELNVAANERRTTVPPGVTGKIPFTFKNTGTVTDTFDLRTPGLEKDRQRYLNADGLPVTELALAPGASFRGEVAYDINSTDAKDTEFDTAIIAVSRIVHTRHTQDVTFVVGPDTIAPDITLESPKSTYLRDEEIVIRIRDNVAVTEAEADLGTGSQFVPIAPTTEGGTLYALNATGQPQQFTFRVRASDAAGNTHTQQYTITRDRTDPRITNIRFTPATGAQPGDSVNVIIEAQDENMERVEATVWQRQPGPDYKTNFTLQFGGGRWLLRDWIVPERPGYFQFNFTATDRAGNEVREVRTYIVNGLDILIVSNNPNVSPRVPLEGQTVTFAYIIENTSPRFETGEFDVLFSVDAQRGIGRRINLEPAERTIVQFNWVATRGPHDFALVVDQRLEVFEDKEGDANNVLRVTSTNLFPDNPLFAAPDDALGPDGFGERLQRYWYVGVLMLAVGVLFTIALVLGRRPLV